MSRPEAFILTSDFATLKNDDRVTGSVTLTPQILDANQIVTVSSDLVVGTIGASSRTRIASSKDGNEFYVCNVLSLTRTGQIAGPTDVLYNVFGFVSRISPTTVRISVSVQNPYAEGMGTAFGDETLTFEISTFLSPFQ